MLKCRSPQLLYLTTYPNEQFQVESMYIGFKKLTKLSLCQYLNSLVQSNQIKQNYKPQTLRDLLNIRKHLPLIVNQQTVLFPIHHKRAFSQHFINGLLIVGLKQTQNQTCITFTNGEMLYVDAPFDFVQRKWMESILAHHLVFRAIDYTDTRAIF